MDNQPNNNFQNQWPNNLKENVIILFLNLIINNLLLEHKLNNSYNSNNNNYFNNSNNNYYFNNSNNNNYNKMLFLKILLNYNNI